MNAIPLRATRPVRRRPDATTRRDRHKLPAMTRRDSRDAIATGGGERRPPCVARSRAAPRLSSAQPRGQLTSHCGNRQSAGTRCPRLMSSSDSRRREPRATCKPEVLRDDPEGIRFVPARTAQCCIPATQRPARIRFRPCETECGCCDPAARVTNCTAQGDQVQILRKAEVSGGSRARILQTAEPGRRARRTRHRRLQRRGLRARSREVGVDGRARRQPARPSAGDDP